MSLKDILKRWFGGNKTTGKTTEPAAGNYVPPIFTTSDFDSNTPDAFHEHDDTDDAHYSHDDMETGDSDANDASFDGFDGGDFGGGGSSDDY
jgi:hypothetical protein